MMATEEEPDALQIYWERFFKAETGTYEKSTWLELFLAEFIIRLNESQNPKKLINFCPVSGVVSLVGCELLCGIHRVTSSINTHYSLSSIEPVPVHNDVTDQPEVPLAEARGPLSAFSRMQAQPASVVLRAHLQAGLAWRCLLLLRALGVEGLSCCRQLSSVLIWVYGETCTGMAPPSTSPGVKPSVSTALRPGQRPPIHRLFSNRIWSKQKSSNVTGSNHSAASSEKSYISFRSRMSGRPRSNGKETNRRNKSSIKNSEVSTDSGDSNDDLQMFNRSMTIKVCATNDDFEYFNSPLRSSDDCLNHSLYSDPFYLPRKAKPKAADYMTDKHREIINSEISTFQFTLLITDLLQELCKAESSLSGSEGSQISMQCINFALKNLCSLQFGSAPYAATSDALETSRVKVALTELLMVSLDQVLVHADLCAKLINNGILPMLLRLLEDVVCKSSAKCNAKTEKGVKECANEEETENLLKFVFGIAYSITAFFHCLLMQCRSLDRLREFTEQFALYAECHKGGLLRQCVELMLDAAPPAGPALALVHALVDAAARLVRAMQRVRGAVLHAAACPRARHSSCRARVAAGRRHHHDALGVRAACAVAVLCAALAALLARAPAGARVLRALLRCGLCCCFPRALLAQAVVRAVLARAVPAAAGLRLLERAAYGEPRAARRLPCAVCEVRADERRGRCAFLVHYNSLLQLDNPNSVLHATVAHLLKVTPRCSPDMKYELLFSVIYPTFIVAKHRYAMRSEESAHFLTASCLNIISSLLSTVSFAEQFIQKGGLSYILELISMPDFSNQCCAILEVAIIVEIMKLIKENEEFPYFREVGSLTSVQILFKSLSDATEKCFEVYKTKFSLEKYEELCNIDKEKEMLGLATEAPSTGRMDPEEESDSKDEQEAVRDASTFWRCCARLCLHSPLLREHAVRQHVFLRGYALLRLLLHYACQATTVPASNTVLYMVAEVSNMVPDRSNTVSEMSNTITQLSDNESGVSNTEPDMSNKMYKMSNTVPQVPETVPGMSYTMTEISNTMSKISNIMSEVSTTVPKVSNVSTTNSAAGQTVSTAGLVVSIAEPDAKMVLRVVEALLTVQFAVSDETSSRSKDASCAIVRTALSAHASAGVGLRTLCDTLVAVALAAPSARHAMPTLAPLNVRVPPLYCGSESSSPDCSSSEDSAAPYGSEHSDPRPDDGYEADIEISKLELTTSLKSQNLSESLSILDNAMYSQGQGGPDAWGRGQHAQAAHPELCVIVVDILSQLIDKVLSQEASGQQTAEVVRVCAGLARAWAGRARPPRLLAHLLAPAAPAARLLAADDARFAELQRHVLELVSAMGAGGLEACEARALLRLLAAQRPPLALLLPVLARVLAAPARSAPDCALLWPVCAKPEDFVMDEPAASSFAQQAEQAARRLRYSHTRAGISSPWSRGAVRAALGSAGWAPWLQGFAVTMWLKRDPPHCGTQRVHRHSEEFDETDEWHDEPPNPDDSIIRESTKKEETSNESEFMHVFSIGHESLMFELWIDTSNGVISARLSRPETGLNRAAGGARASTRWPRGWACLALNVAERVHRRRIHVEVTIYINGRECETLSLPIQGILVRKATPSTVLLGHAVDKSDFGGTGSLQMGAVRVYRRPVLNAAAALHMAAHGPDQPCEIPCESANFPSIITPELLELDIDWDAVYEVSSQTLRELHENLLVSFFAHAPDTMNLYHQTTSVPAVLGARDEPAAVRAQWAGAARVAHSGAAARALLLLGGAELLMYMVARVVELGGTARQQAAALATALRAGGAEARLRAQLLGGALQLLPPLLGSQKCHVSPYMLKVILDAAFSAPVLQCGSAGVLLRARAGAVLREPRLLLLLLQAWRCFDTDEEVSWQVSYGKEENGFGYKDKVSCGRDSTWVVALAALRVALGGVYRTFNQYQACRVDLLRHLLLACKERFLTSERPALSTAASKELVGLVRALLGEPPLLGHLAMLCDFLLLMHQASDTFVTHSRANFYFLLTTDTPESSDFNFLDFISKRKKSSAPDNRRYYDAMEKSSSSSVSEEAAPDSDRAGTDCDKHIKALINMQIKENRQKLSSTSETSDTATEKSVEGPNEDVYEDTDYVLVEPHPSANDVYSANAHQRQVRAGAEPGWHACEGLLLLLRDAIVALPEDTFEQAAATAIQVESLVVLANHGDAGVRAALVRAAAALQRRRAAALSPLCCLLLADQISMYPCSWELASACAALLTKYDVPLEDQLDEEIWVQLDEDATQRCAPLLALLPGCARASSVPLAHNLAALLRRLLHKASLKALNEVAFVEVIIRAIRAVGTDKTEFEGKDLILEDLYDLLCKVAIKVLSGNHSTQMIIDMHNMLRYIEGEGTEGGEGVDRAPSAVQRAARNAQVALYTAQIDFLEERLRALHQNTPKTFNYFSTVLPSAERSVASETSARLAGTLARGAAFLSTRPARAPLQPDADFFDRLLASLLAGVTNTDNSTSSSRLFGGGGGGGGALSALLWWAASPEPAARVLQPRLLRALYRAPAHVLRVLAGAGARDHDALRKLSVYLLTMVQQVHLEAEAGTGEAASVELAITDWARAWAVAAQAELADSVRGAAVPAAAQRCMRADRQRRARHAAAPRHAAALARAVFARETMAQRATDAAMMITRRVVEAQNAERKAFLEHLRRAHTLHTAAQWQPVIDRHTHERGIFHNPHGYPAAWQLDSTEGPGRVRVRLRRAHLCVSPRHLQGPYKYKADTAIHPAPLGSVLGACAAGAQLAPGEAVSYMARVTRVAVDREEGGELLLTDRHLHFVPEEGAGAARWALGAVARVATRRWCLQERALELFLCCGHALLLAFADTEERTDFLNHLSRAHLPNRTEPQNLTEAMNQWRNGTITNWEYLMILNDLAGRSYNDLMQYPVFPFIIADYTSKILDLTDPASFRDLSKPMAVQNKNREQHYINTYNDLKAARREGCSPLSREPHHYASLYSNSGGVLHYLVRLPPFTELFLNYQDNNFDMPDRTFHSLATTWRLITNDSPTDVKELIPELFYLPELFYNNEGLELGVRQCGARVDDVELPRWAPDARLFTLLHRHALEAPHVTERLPAWIDLVFGYKQTGQPAVDALNVFPACTYYGFDPQQLEDELDRTAAAAMVRTYGQAPRQLLRTPHPQRATELQPRQRPRAPPLPLCAAVRGARWGRYAGSPDCAAPVLVARRRVVGAARVQALAHPRAAAACARSLLLLAVREDGEGGVGEALCAVWWGHADGAVRTGAGGTLLWAAAGERVSAAGAWARAGGWGVTGALGFSSGRLVALRAGARVTAHALHAHEAPVADVVLCPPASLLVSASVDGVIVLWDLNDLSFIRTLPNRDMLPVQCVAVSETLSDVATVHEPRVTRNGRDGDVTVHSVAADVDETGDDDVKEYERDAYNCKSLIRVHSVNGKFVASVRVSGAVTRVAYSAAAEGVSANCVAAALMGGGVRLYSAWDLRPVAAIAPPMSLAPLVPLVECASLASNTAPACPYKRQLISWNRTCGDFRFITFSSDSQLLLGCYADGTLVAWESLEGGARAAPVRLVPASSLL